MNARLSARPPLILLLVYFGAHVAARVLSSDALELDEAEQVLWTQHLAAGYGSQPPLYTWLQWLVFQIFGVSVLALSLMKNALLALTYGCTWLAARSLMPARPALLAAACMLLIPQIGWESQRDLTHSVLVTALAAASLLIVTRLLTEGPRPSLYLALGAAAGLGMLAKYSYAVFAAATLLALLASGSARPVWRSPWIALSALVALLVFLPHGLWLLDHWQMASSGTLDKLDAGEAAPLRGLGSLLGAAFATLGGLALILVLVFGRDTFRRVSGSQHCGFFLRYAAALALLMLALVFIGGATHFKGRWLQPLLFMAPLAFFCCRPHLAGSRRLPWLYAVLMLFAVLYLSLSATRPLLDGWRNRPDELNEPASRLAAALIAAGYDGRAPILTDIPVLGGVLRLHFPQAQVAIWKTGNARPALPDGPRLVISRGDRAEELLERDSAGAGERLHLHYLHAHPGHPPVRYRYALVR